MDEDLCGVYVKRIEENAEIVLSHCLDSKLLKNRLSSSFVAEDVYAASGKRVQTI